ncbi:TetR/AcrR family transcriptional regulator [Andreprevotia chitinilytica]|uniref:TetR/AcrR family transcriptional regulator n=1 Tax=Andreprevotia chitinilytica TaxID=396808 RepID=UPI000690244A|nr:TetR/AcrR family transcriptional regulator [Andreprevotia chitinilytica]
MTSQLQRATQTRQALLAAAEALIAEHGYARLNEDRVCTRADLSRGALRHHYHNGRYDLLPALLTQLIERQSAELASATPRERAHHMLRGILDDPGKSSVVAIFELWMAVRGDARLAARLNPIFSTAFERLLGVQADQGLALDILALRLILSGACMHRFSQGYDRAALVSTVQWLLACLPPVGLTPQHPVGQTALYDTVN